MPVKTQPPDFGCHPIDATGPDSAVTCVDRLLLVTRVPEQTPYLMAMHARVIVDEFTDMVGFCFRKLEISPWGDDERAEIEAELQAERAGGES